MSDQQPFVRLVTLEHRNVAFSTDQRRSELGCATEANWAAATRPTMIFGRYFIMDYLCFFGVLCLLSFYSLKLTRSAFLVWAERAIVSTISATR